MKILFLTKELPFPVNNGHRMRSYHYLKGLLKNNEVTIVCFGNEQAPGEGVTHFKNLNCQIEFVDTKLSFLGKNKYLMAVVSLFSILPYAIKLRYSPEMEKRVAHIVQQKGIEVIVCDGIHQARHVSAYLKCYKILDEHNVESMIIKRFYEIERNPIKKLYAKFECWKFKEFEDHKWPRFDEIHVCSEVDKKQVEKRIPHSVVHVIPNGVDTKKFTPSNLPIKQNRLIYTGLIGWKPNEDAILYFVNGIYPLIKKQIPEIEFYVVGKDPLSAVKRLAERDRSIVVTGMVPDVKPYVDESAVFVVPLRIGSGTRLKILEAWSMGKAIVSTTIGCEGLSVSNGDNIFIADEPVAFSNNVVKLIRDSNLREKLGRNGRALVEREYDWEVVGLRIANRIELLNKQERKQLGT